MRESRFTDEQVVGIIREAHREPAAFAARVARTAPRDATGWDAAVCGASASRPVASSPHLGQQQRAGGAWLSS